LPGQKSRCSSGVERFLGKEEVTSSNLVIGSLIFKELRNLSDSFFLLLNTRVNTKSLFNKLIN
jgi:hypothetical protein